MLCRYYEEERHSNNPGSTPLTVRQTDRQTGTDRLN